jgi:hypothetical protein
MAVAYPDGWGIYSVHGVIVNEKIIKREYTVKDIDKENNSEVRRVMIELYGQEKYMNDSGAKMIHKDGMGELYRKELSDDEPIVMVKLWNSTPEPDGSIKIYWLRVPPGIKTAREAVAWSFGKEEIEYQPLQET